MAYNSSINGTITFYQEDGEGPVAITILLSGLDPSSARGLHIQSEVFYSLRVYVDSILCSEYGNFTAGCRSLGVHYNPFYTTHGDPLCGDHHLGDLGNVPSDTSGMVNFTLTSNELSLNGRYSIVGYVIALPSRFPG
jgi:superoxide dismutase, Cu-Zn family